MRHAEKIQLIKTYSKHYKVFVETGTYLGKMIEAVQMDFEKLFSIEVDPELYHLLDNKFPAWVKLYCGDSAELLHDILDKITEPTLFYLDAHGKFGETTAPCPLVKEIEIILASDLQDYILLIDDIDLLGKHDFPTLEQIESLLGEGDKIGNFLVYECNKLQPV